MSNFKKYSKLVIVTSLIAVAAFIVGFASNQETFADVPIENLTATYERPVIFFGPTPTTPEEAEERRLELRIAHFEMYEEFGLIFDPATDHLYFNGELVRYFTDMIPFPYTSASAGASFGMTLLTENGTVDVRAVRDFSQMNLQGTIDLRKGLLGVEAFTQAEFDARDIDAPIEPPTATVFISQPIPDSWGTQNDVSHAICSDIFFSIERDLPTPQRTFTEIFLEYEEWGLTFEGVYSYRDGTLVMREIQNVFYQGQLVRGMVDFGDFSPGLSISSIDRSGNEWVYVIRDENGYITELSTAPALGN